MLAADPLFFNGLDLAVVLIVIVQVVIIFVVGLVATMFMVWLERKHIAGMQNRVGRNQAGPGGPGQREDNSGVPAGMVGRPPSEVERLAEEGVI